MTGEYGDARPPHSARRHRIRAEAERRLRDADSLIMKTPDGPGQLGRQIDAVLDDVLAAVGDRPAGSQGGLSSEIGAGRAAMQVPPVESLYAAQVLFDVILPVLADEDGQQAGAAGATVDLALALHRSIMRRVGAASVAYVDFLLQRLHVSQREERLRVARELHDRPAHGVGVGLQSLELHDLYAATDPRRAADRLVIARQALREALETIKGIAWSLRDNLGSRTLAEALTDLLEHTAPPGVTTSVVVSGTIEGVPAAILEEVYLVMREALHNAVKHADPGALLATVSVERAMLRAEVTDDGVGFDPATAGPGIGLSSMSERVDLLGGRVEVSSGRGCGTRVRALIPLSVAAA